MIERRVEVEVEVEVERKCGLQRFYWLMRGTNERTSRLTDLFRRYNIVRSVPKQIPKLLSL